MNVNLIYSSDESLIVNDVALVREASNCVDVPILELHRAACDHMTRKVWET